MNRHRSVAAEVAQLQNDINGMDVDQIRLLYGITIDTDTGHVYDVTYNKHFSSLTKWVVFNSEQDDNDDYDNEEQYGRFSDED